jgi:hypothetical protein
MSPRKIPSQSKPGRAVLPRRPNIKMPTQPSTPTPLNSAERLQALHGWYTRNVMALRLTPEVERLWWDWLKAGYNGNDLRDVVRYIRRQISTGKRNEGALKLSNLFARSESGFLKFDEDLGLARARGNLSVDKRLEMAPDSEDRSEQLGVRTTNSKLPPSKSDPAAAQHALDELRKAKERL